eukprot:TRINITY_DN4441_c0_g1_i1.p1 TRINITY_DN4441_c0_g1~~TRINITY_DN4441_c0_g1_i1.p1  ORF type:complete len:186 (-),score=50.07 TRINITY_DN4441_c0_g1_i1:10-567(-)
MGEKGKKSSKSSVASPYELITVSNVLQITPNHTSNIFNGVNEKLQNLLMQNNETIGGWVIAIKDVKVLTDKARIMYETPEIHVPVSYSALVFNPQMGDALIGCVNSVSMEHIGLLIDDFFNASVYDHTLLQEFSFDESLNQWTFNSDPTLTITEGTYVKFFVQNIHRSKQKMISVTGSLRPIADQ